MSDPTALVPSLHDQLSDANVGYGVPADAVDSLNAWIDEHFAMTDADVDAAYVAEMERRDAEALLAEQQLVRAMQVALEGVAEILVAVA